MRDSFRGSSCRFFFSRVFTLQSSASSRFGYSTGQDLDSAYAELFFAVGMASKQKYKSLSVKQKLEILERLDHLPAHKKKKDIAAEFGIPCSTLSTILKNKETLKRQHALGSSKKFRLKESTKPDVDATLFQWFTAARAQSVPLSGEILKAKAEELNSRMGHDQWSCSSG